MSERKSKSLQAIAGLTLLISLVAAGYLSRSPWIIILANPALVVLYATGKLSQWQMAWRIGGVKSVAQAALVTSLAQIVLGYVFYLIGLGLSRLTTDPAAPIAPLGSADAIGVCVVFAICLACSILVLSSEKRAGSDAAEPGETSSSKTLAEVTEVELDIDPKALTTDEFYKSSGYWVPDPLREALVNREARVVKRPLGASEAEIAAAEERLGFSLPEKLRSLYRIMDGGHVGEVYVPLAANPRPVYEDWRGAFSVGYSDLRPLNRLRTLRECYEDFTDDPDEFPEHADALLVLSAFYGDMTVLDYSKTEAPQVWLAEFDGNRGEGIRFETFEEFFAALRRPREQQTQAFDRKLYRSSPLGSLPVNERASAFWVCEQRASQQPGDRQSPPASHEALLAEAEARVGVKMPEIVSALWRVQNGGEVAYRFLDDDNGDELVPFEALIPLERITTLEDLSRRIDFPSDEVPWHESIPDLTKLVVLNGSSKQIFLLDYRNGPRPSLLLVRDFLNHGLKKARSFHDVEAFFLALRKFERSSLLPPM